MKEILEFANWLLPKFGRQKTVKEAVAFYFKYCFLGVLIAVLVAVVRYLQTGEYDLGGSIRIGAFVAVVIDMTLGIKILKDKQLVHNFFYLFLTICSGILAGFFGIFVGLLPVAFLTTRKPKKRSHDS